MYLRFGCARTLAGQLMASMSNMLIQPDNDGRCAAMWHLYVGPIAVELVYAPRAEPWRTTVNAWHPRLHTSRFRGDRPRD